jgi:hypothetical protein
MSRYKLSHDRDEGNGLSGVTVARSLKSSTCETTIVKGRQIGRFRADDAPDRQSYGSNKVLSVQF